MEQTCESVKEVQTLVKNDANYVVWYMNECACVELYEGVKDGTMKSKS